MENFTNQYGFLIVQMALQAVLALSLYLPLMAGQLSLASPAFYAVGGYVAAVLSTQKFLPPPGTTFPEPLQSFTMWLATIFPAAEGGFYPIGLILLEMLIAAVICALLALIVGFPALRLRGIYLALATIAFVEIVRVLSLNLPITGGAIGIFNIPQPFHTKFEYLWIVGPLLVLSVWFVARLERTRVGRAFSSLREDELAATAMGINPTYHKVLAFTLGAVLAGIVGVLSAHFLNTWNARQGTFDLGVLVLAYVIIGGARTFAGPVLGALLLTALPEVLRALAGVPGLPAWLTEFLRAGRLIIYGILIAVGTVFFPQGLITPEIFSRRRRPPRIENTGGGGAAPAEVP
jgi:branched-chain amino acid transport system permease protein